MAKQDRRAQLEAWKAAKKAAQEAGGAPPSGNTSAAVVSKKKKAAAAKPKKRSSRRLTATKSKTTGSSGLAPRRSKRIAKTRDPEAEEVAAATATTATIATTATTATVPVATATAASPARATKSGPARKNRKSKIPVAGRRRGRGQGKAINEVGSGGAGGFVILERPEEIAPTPAGRADAGNAETGLAKAGDTAANATGAGVAAPVAPEDGVAPMDATSTATTTVVRPRRKFGDATNRVANKIVGAGVPAARKAALVTPRVVTLDPIDSSIREATDLLQSGHAAAARTVLVGLSVSAYTRAPYWVARARAEEALGQFREVISILEQAQKHGAEPTNLLSAELRAFILRMKDRGETEDGFEVGADPAAPSSLSDYAAGNPVGFHNMFSFLVDSLVASEIMAPTAADVVAVEPDEAASAAESEVEAVEAVESEAETGAAEVAPLITRPAAMAVPPACASPDPAVDDGGDLRSSLVSSYPVAAPEELFVLPDISDVCANDSRENSGIFGAGVVDSAEASPTSDALTGLETLLGEEVAVPEMPAIDMSKYLAPTTPSHGFASETGVDDSFNDDSDHHDEEDDGIESGSLSLASFTNGPASASKRATPSRGMLRNVRRLGLTKPPQRSASAKKKKATRSAVASLAEGDKPSSVIIFSPMKRSGRRRRRRGTAGNDSGDEAPKFLTPVRRSTRASVKRTMDEAGLDAVGYNYRPNEALQGEHNLEVRPLVRRPSTKRQKLSPVPEDIADVTSKENMTASQANASPAARGEFDSPISRKALTRAAHAAAAAAGAPGSPYGTTTAFVVVDDGGEGRSVVTPVRRSRRLRTAGDGSEVDNAIPAGAIVAPNEYLDASSPLKRIAFAGR